MAASSAIKSIMRTPFEPRVGSQLCELCATIFSEPDDARRFIHRETLSYRRRYQSLVDSEERGCQLCNLFLSIIEGPPAELKDEVSAPAGDADNPTDMDSSDIVECLLAIEGEGIHTVRITCRIDQRSDSFKLFAIAAHQDDPAAEQIPLRLLNPIFNCPRTFARVKQWLEDCHSNHEDCNKCQLGPAKANIKPTYLLYFGSCEEVVFLQPMKPGTDVNYAALSYRWGTRQPHATTLKRLEAYEKEGIPIQRLPRTIQHAIIVCKQIGLGFLWVDALCIPQDSPAHLERELAIMGAIYHNAYVVISASSAKSCDDGFLDERRSLLEPIQMPFGESGIINLTPKSEAISRELKYNVQPLNDRAWAYQESYMARRLLAFHTLEVVWSCGQRCGDSVGMRGPNPMFSKLFGDSCRDAETFQGEFRDWGFLIAAYSNRKLSCSSDKLPAISAIAELFNLEKEGDYVAGMWVGAINQLIAWYMPYYGDDLQPTRPATWRAPSWSYMSIDGPLAFIDLNGHHGSRPVEAYQGFNWTASFSVKPKSSENPYGEITDAKIRFHGQLLEVRIGSVVDRWREFHVEQASQQSGVSWPPNVEPSSWSVVFDAMTPAGGGETAMIASCYGNLPVTDCFWWLPLYHTRRSVNSKWSREEGYRYGQSLIGLALACLPDGRFHRVGHILCRGEEGELLVEQIKQLEPKEFTFV